MFIVCYGDLRTHVIDVGLVDYPSIDNLFHSLKCPKLSTFGPEGIPYAAWSNAGCLATQALYDEYEVSV